MKGRVAIRYRNRLMALLLCLALAFACLYAAVAHTGKVSAAEADAYEGTGFESNVTSAAEAIAQAEEVNSQIAEEGIALLKNNGTLPLAKNGKINVFGKNTDPSQSVYGGSGSAGGTGTDAVSLYDSLESAGYTLNPALKEFYADSARSGSGRGGQPSMSQESTGYYTGETAPEKYDAALKATFTEYDDASVVMFSRVAGEGFDLPRESKDIPGRSDPKQHYLELDDYEKAVLDMAKEASENVIVIINSAETLEMGELEADTEVDAILWVAPPGGSGFEPVGRVINGDVNPSAHTVDTWAADFTADPTWENFCKNNANPSKLNADGSVKDEYKAPDGSTVTNQFYDESGTLVTKKFQIAYEEGIYFGYGYWETRAFTEGKGTSDEWYQDHVVYPLGYGLSYTTFEQTVKSVTLGGTAVNDTKITEADLDKEITFTVTVKNTGKVAGKDVVQMYFNVPYYEGGIEKIHVELGGFAKTSMLEPNESEDVTISMTVRDLASYDWNDLNDNGWQTYELDAGEYNFYVGTDAHCWYGNEPDATLVVGDGSDYTAETCGEDAIIANIVADGDPDMYEGKKSTNQYDDVSSFFVEEGEYIGEEEGQGFGTILSRADFEGTWPAPPTYEELVKDQAYIDSLQYPDPTKEGKEVGEVSDYDKGQPWEKTKEDLDATLTVGGETYKAYSEKQLTADDDVITLAAFVETIRGTDGKISYELTDWAPFLAQLTLEQMAELVRDGGFRITMPGMDVFGIDEVTVGDGGTGFTRTNVEGYDKGLTYVSTCMVAATWSTELAAMEGSSLGDEGIWLNVQGLYGVGTNLHRSPFGGRNFEYFSESELLAGKMVAAITAAAQEKGLILFNKHFFLNDTEQDRDQTGLLTWATEQTMRERYMKVEEIVVREADSLGMMTAFNRIGDVWVGEHYATLTNVLRGEWGFEGVVVTDGQNGWMKNARMIRAGGDLALAMLGKIELDVTSDWAKNDPTHIYSLRQAAKNILFGIAQSNVMNRCVKYADLAPEDSLGYYNPGDNVDADKMTVANTVLEAAAEEGKLPEFTYEIREGALPEGLTMAADGSITGTVGSNVKDGVYKFSVALKTADGYIASQIAEFSVTIGELAQVDDYIGIAQRGEMFSMYVQSGKGGVGNNPSTITYKIKDGYTLPAGLSLDSAEGIISGVATEAGRFDTMVEATDPATKEVVEYPVTIYVNDYRGTITYKAITLPEATVGEYYCVSVGTATNGEGRAISYAVNTSFALVITEDGWEGQTLNALPAGLSISSNGIIYGVPTAATEGTEVNVTASAPGYASVDAAFNFVVNAAGTGSTDPSVPGTDDDALDEINASIEELTEKLAALEAKVTAGDTEADALAADIAELKEDVAALSGGSSVDLSAIEARIAALEEQMKDGTGTEEEEGGCGSSFAGATVAGAVLVLGAAAVCLASLKRKNS